MRRPISSPAYGVGGVLIQECDPVVEVGAVGPLVGYEAGNGLLAFLLQPHKGAERLLLRYVERAETAADLHGYVIGYRIFDVAEYLCRHFGARIVVRYGGYPLPVAHVAHVQYYGFAGLDRRAHRLYTLDFDPAVDGAVRDCEQLEGLERAVEQVAVIFAYDRADLAFVLFGEGSGEVVVDYVVAVQPQPERYPAHRIAHEIVEP